MANINSVQAGALNIQTVYSIYNAFMGGDTTFTIKPLNYDGTPFNCTPLTSFGIQFDNGKNNLPEYALETAIPDVIVAKGVGFITMTFYSATMFNTLTPLFIGGITGGRASVYGQAPGGTALLIGVGSWKVTMTA
jgi:hypothetical protein